MRRRGWSAAAGAGIAGLLVAAPLARAADDSKKGPTTVYNYTSSGASTALPSKQYKVIGKIQKYDHNQDTITLDGSDKTLKVRGSTMVVKDGAKASASDLHEGDEVRASYADPSYAEPTGAFEAVVIEVVPDGAVGSSG